jgi:hypothetical protein
MPPKAPHGMMLARRNFGTLPELVAEATHTMSNLSDIQKMKGTIIVGRENDLHIKNNDFSKGHMWDINKYHSFEEFIQKKCAHLFETRSAPGMVPA